MNQRSLKDTKACGRIATVRIWRMAEGAATIAFEIDPKYTHIGMAVLAEVLAGL